jgi:hypothetical protein
MPEQGFHRCADGGGNTAWIADLRNPVRGGSSPHFPDTARPDTVSIRWAAALLLGATSGPSIAVTQLKRSFDH